MIQHGVRPVVVSTGTCAESVDLEGLPAGRYHLDWILSVTPNPVVVTVGSVDFVVGDGGPPVAVPGLKGENLRSVSLGSGNKFKPLQAVTFGRTLGSW